MLSLALSLLQDTDPLLLEVNGKGTIPVFQEGIYETRGGKIVDVDAIVKAAERKRFVFVGESHDQKPHHEMQAAIIRALADSGRDVVVGFEMFTRDNQPNLAPWTAGRWTREEFIENSNWKTQWGFDFAIYEPIFSAVRELRLPMVALNVPRDWVRSVGRGGVVALSEEQRKWVPNPDLGNAHHRELFWAMIGGGHPMTGPAAENMYAAQVTWDEGMATSALDHMNGRFSKNVVMVVVAGSGHMMYGQGINYRIRQKTGEAVVNVLCMQAEGPRAVSKGIADFVYVSR